ncbi:uncharacterized protein LOC128223610 [Mya arenaria]|uniref:uncharacterized protein LOC128223610 n=1 Tax=Mya arenaria TaxID=6604 RepID=UPI0022E47DF5|nr:uncharacterized protein LOC128223610 [Mya arenaria]
MYPYHNMIATRILAFLSIVNCIVAFAALNEATFGIFMTATAIFSVMSPFTFNCCCYSDCSRNTKTEKAIGHWGVYVWMFMSDMGYVIIFGYSWYVWTVSSYQYHNYDNDIYYDEYSSTYGSYYPNFGYNRAALFDTIFAFSLIITFFLSIFNLFSFCLVYKYGCCFMRKFDRYYSEQGVEMAIVMNQQISTIGGCFPANGLQNAQQTFTSPGVQYAQYQQCLAGPDIITAPSTQNIGVATDYVDVSSASTMAVESGWHSRKLL